MKKMLLKFYRMKWSYSALWLLIFTYIFPILFILLMSIFIDNPEMDQSYVSMHSFWGGLVFVSLFVPIIETFFNQFLPYVCFLRFFRSKLFLSCLLSGSLFGIMHYNSNFVNVIVTGSVGFLLQLGYVLYARKYSYRQAFWIITTVHSIRNMVTASFAFLFGFP